jgi:hypothetical protein
MRIRLDTSGEGVQILVGDANGVDHAQSGRVARVKVLPLCMAPEVRCPLL